MSSAQQNVARLAEGYRLWSESRGQSVDDWCSIFADDLVLRTLGAATVQVDAPKPGMGKESLRGYLAAINQNWAMLEFAVTDFIAQDDRVVAISQSSWRCRHTGRTMDLTKVDVWRFRDGLAVEFFESYDTAAAIAAAQP